MDAMIKSVLVVLATAGVLLATGCKSDGSFEEHEKTQGEEIEAMEEHGGTAIDVADEATE